MSLVRCTHAQLIASQVLTRVVNTIERKTAYLHSHKPRPGIWRVACLAVARGGSEPFGAWSLSLSSHRMSRLHESRRVDRRCCCRILRTMLCSVRAITGIRLIVKPYEPKAAEICLLCYFQAFRSCDCSKYCRSYLGRPAHTCKRSPLDNLGAFFSPSSLSIQSHSVQAATEPASIFDCLRDARACKQASNLTPVRRNNAHYSGSRKVPIPERKLEEEPLELGTKHDVDGRSAANHST